MKNYYGIDFAKRRNEILKSDAFKPIIDHIMSNADNALEAEYIVDRMSDYMSYYSTGRRADEEHIKRRGNCISLAIAYWLYEDKKYLNELIDVIYIICNEFTWCIPAHSHMEQNPHIDYVIRTIDLYQTTTARILTEVAVLLGDKLPYYVTERIEYELRRRVFDGYKKYPYFHAAEGQLNNWSTVCACGSGTALLHFGTDQEISALLPRIIKGLDRYLQGTDSDGCCREGTGYWCGGFGAYIYLANIVYIYSDGEIDYFNNNKSKSLAVFPQKARLNESMTVSFADASPEFSFSPGLFCFLKKHYPDVILPELKYFKKHINDIFREILWMDTDYTKAAEQKGVSYFDDAQWYINRQEKFSFAAKGGHNYEPHNHNDLGSFMIAVGDDIPLADLGAPEYIKYDHYDDRKVNLNFSSKGHSVPIINGEYQALGENFKAIVTKKDNNLFSLDLQGAYKKGLVTRYNRTFTVNEDGVTIKDIFYYSKQTENITERFVTRTKPKISDGEVDLGSAKILFDSDLYSVKVSTDFYNKHGYGIDVNKRIKITVYLIDFTAKHQNQTEFDFNIKIK